jgi:hypothetical protein
VRQQMPLQRQRSALCLGPAASANFPSIFLSIYLAA